MACQNDNFDRTPVQLIIEFLSDVQRLGVSAAVDKLWLDDNLGLDLTKLTTSHEAFSDASPFEVFDVIKRVATMRDTMYQLAQTLEERLEVRRANLKPSFFYCGIQKLPNEILKDIFERAVPDGSGHMDQFIDGFRASTGVVLSHTCSRFRAIALSTPSLWSRLSSKMSTSCIRIRLERAKSATLAIIIDGSRSYEQLKQFCSVVAPHSSRWRCFQVHSMYCQGRNYDGPQYFTECLGRLHLPNVDHFAYSCTERFKFSQSWIMPNARHIYLHVAIPSAASVPNLLSPDNITSLKFSSPLDKYCDTNALIPFLASLPNLTTLRLDTSDVSDDEDDEDDEDDVRPDEVLLPKLNCLTLSTRHANVYERIVTSLRLPSLETLKLHIKDVIEYDEDVWEDVRYLLPHGWINRMRPEQFASVRKLDLFFDCARFEFMDLSEIFKAFPSIEVLDLDLKLVSPVFHTPTNIPPLRSLSLRLDPEIEYDFLKPFAKSLKESERWETFEFFHFTNVGLLPRREAKKILTKDKVKWDV